MKHIRAVYPGAVQSYANRLGIYDFWVGKQGKVHWGGFIADAATPEKHIIYLLCFKQPDDLPFILKNASHDFIKAAIAYAVENKRADVLLDIFKNYQRDSTFKFLKNEANLIKKIEICLKEDVILQSHYKKIIFDKLELIG